MTRALVAALALTAVLAAGAFGAAAKPDAHDRALARALAAKVNTFREIAAQKNGSDTLQKSLDACPLLKKDPSQAFAALFAAIPVLLTEIVNDFGPQLRDLHQTLLDMDPHATVFRRWTAAEGASFALLLRFDNHGKKVDLCEATTVLLDKKSTAADIRRVVGIDPSLIPLLFKSPASSTLTKLNPKMRRFFVAAGLSKADAKTLTS